MNPVKKMRRKIKMTFDEKYERYCEYAKKCGFRPCKKDTFIETRQRIKLLVVHPTIEDCEALNFIISMELPNKVSYTDIRGYDVIVIPYEGYYDDIVQQAIDMDAKILSLESYGDFEIIGKDDKPTSIMKYIDTMDYGIFALYDKHAITEFRDEFFFLSNFYLCDITFDGINYKNAEAAFQAQKCEDTKEKFKFTELAPGDAKRLGKTVKLRKDWNDVRIDIMRKVVKAKFDQNMGIKEKLIATDNRCLIEVNVWKDKFWGVSCGSGKNMLGRILMDLRKEYLTEAKTS